MAKKVSTRKLPTTSRTGSDGISVPVSGKGCQKMTPLARASRRVSRPLASRS